MTNGDVVLLAPSATELINSVMRSLTENGQACEVTEEVVAGFKLVKITVVGKRAGEGQIARAMKGEK